MTYRRPAGFYSMTWRINVLLMLYLSLLFLTGCNPMNTAYAKPDNTVADWPLKFVRHSFGAACYSTYGCKVRYNNFLFIDDPDDKLEVSSASLGKSILPILVAATWA